MTRFSSNNSQAAEKWQIEKSIISTRLLFFCPPFFLSGWLFIDYFCALRRHILRNVRWNRAFFEMIRRIAET
jgi:hypothetical protein